MPTYASPEDADDALHTLLLRAVPKNQHGNKTVAHLAFLLGIKRWSIQKWIMAKRLSPKRVTEIVTIGQMDLEPGDPPEGRVSRADFERFIYNV